MEDLKDAIAYNSEALTLRPRGHSDRYTSLNNLANAVLTRYEQSSGMEDLDNAIAYNREALALCPLGHQHYPLSLNNLAIAVLARYNQSGRMEDLEESITYSSKSLALRPLGHPGRSISLINLANAIRDRYDRLGRMEDLDEAIKYNREALALSPLGHQYHSTSLDNLAIAVRTRYNQSSQMEDLEEAITYSSKALALRPLGHPDRSSSLINLANAIRDRYDRLGRMEDLDEAIKYNREALALSPLGHQCHSISLNNLAIAVRTRYNQSGRMEDLEGAISYNSEALSLCPCGHPGRSTFLNSLANAVLTRYKQLGRMGDLESAITYSREALALRPLGHPDRSRSLINLARAVSDRYDRLGRVDDLDEAIKYNREALALSPLGHQYHSTSLNNLATVVFTRYKQLGRMEDLEDVITYNREALALRPLGHPDRSNSLINLAGAVSDRYDQLGRMDDLDETIKYNREAFTLSPLGHQYHSSSLNNLAVVTLTRYRQSRQVEDLKEAITYSRKALMLRPLGHPDRFMSLNNLANAVLSRHHQFGRMGDLEETITYYQEALDLCPLGHPFRSAPLANLANAVLRRFGQSGNLRDLDESIMLYEQVANGSAASFKNRLAAAIKWADVARLHHHASIIRAYSTSLRLLDRCLISYPDVESQQKFLATAQIPKSLASDAASAAIDAQDFEAAVELLDKGRAILWSKMEGYRYPLEQLRQIDGQLADQFESVSVQLERLALSSKSGPMESESPTSLPHWDFQMQRCRILTEEWEKLIGQIRKIEGFSNFLQAIPFTTLRTAAAEGPIILVNVSNYRSDAIILHIDKPLILVTLPNIQPKYLTHLAEQVALARKPDTANPLNLFLPILRDLWNDIVSPVHDCLTRLAVPQKSRIWWCPTSELCALPLHAAGLYQPQQRNLPDIYTSSYIPTVSALITARSNMVGQSIVPKLLLIGQPGETLRNVQDEIDNVRQLGDFVDVIVGADACRDAVLHGLRQHSWAHFACHGHLGNNSQPFHASFQLHGGSRLTLLDLIQARLPNAELAFLSACHSAAGDLTTPDETIHLAAALQFCGFRSVVGTLWAMEDEDGPTVSKEFYKYMFRNPGNKVDFRDSAEALNVATRAMRKNRVPLERWIMFVHIGA